MSSVRLTQLKRKSIIWKFFEETEEGEIKCLLCLNIVLKRMKNKPTTILYNHLKSKHPFEGHIANIAQTNVTNVTDLATSSTSTTTTTTSNSSRTRSGSRSGQQKSNKKRKVGESDQQPYVQVTGGTLEKKETVVHVSEELASCNFHPSLAAVDPTYIDLLNAPRCRKKSVLWRYYRTEGICPDDETTLVKCLVCDATLKQYGNTTTNLKRHLKMKHPALDAILEGKPGVGLQIQQELKPAPLSSPRSHANKSTTHPGNLTGKRQIKDRKKLIDGKLISMIALDLQPVSIVEREGFKDLLNAMDPQYIIPDRKCVSSQLLPDFYKQIVDQVLGKLEGVNYIALTTDLWSPRDQETYLSVSAQYISPTEWTSQSVMLSTTTFYGNPNGKDISSELQRVASEWNLSERTTVMVTDNDTNTLLANEQLPWAYIPCLGHLIHLVVSEAITADKEALALIEKVNSIVSFFQHNKEAMQNLIGTVKSMELNLPERKLVINVPSRWNSIYYMLEAVSEQIDAVNAVLGVYELGDKVLSTNEAAVIKMLLSSLKPFEVATTTLSTEQCNSISMAMPIIKGLVKMMSAVTGAKEPLTTALREGLIQSFGKIEEIECIIAATLLDPRFKRFPFAGKEVIERAKKVVISDIAKMMGMDEDEINGTTMRTLAPSSKLGGEDSFWNYLDIMTNDSQDVTQATSSPTHREIMCYMESPLIGKDENPLLYWKQHQELFPNLSKLALKYLTVPITSVPSSRLFSKAGDDLVEKRSILKPKNVNMILFLNKNFPACTGLSSTSASSTDS